MRQLIKYLFFISILISLSGCYVLNPSIMFRTKKGFKFNEFQDSLALTKEYKIVPNDVIDFRIYSNDGFKLIDITSLNNALMAGGTNNRNAGMLYVVEHDGFVKLPTLGRVKISGLTIRQAELFLEEKYTSFYVKPYVTVNVQSRRVIIFPGTAGTARVINLDYNNTKLIEAIAMAGGLSQNGKAHKIKLIRGNLQNPEIYHIDLSKIEGLRQADMTLQGNDIIYVDPRLNISRELLQEITPILSLLSSTFVAISLINRF